MTPPQPPIGALRNDSMGRILVTDCTSWFGACVFRALFEHVPAPRLLATSADAALVGKLTRAGVEARYAAYDDYESMLEGFQGASKLLLSPAAISPLRTAHHLDAINAATRIGVRHLCYISLGTAERESILQSDRQTEHLIKASGLRYTLLRLTPPGASSHPDALAWIRHWHNLFDTCARLIAEDTTQSGEYRIGAATPGPRLASLPHTAPSQRRPRPCRGAC